MSTDDSIQMPDPEGDATPHPPAASQWEPWAQAGWDPAEVNPYEARQAYDGWQALGNRDTRGYMLERMLQGNELPEGMSWEQAQGAIQREWQSQQDPFQNQQQQGYGYQQDQYQQDQYQPSDQDYADIAAQQGIDPNQLRQVWQNDMTQQLQQFRTQMDTDYQQRQQVEEFGRGMDSLRAQHNLSETDMTFLTPRAAEYAQQGVAMNQAMESAFRDFDEWRRNSLASMGQQQGQAPQNFASQGGIPASPEQPAQTLAEARDFMASQFQR